MNNNKYRLHVLGLPHTITRKEYCTCAFTMCVLKFCKMMKQRGHYIIHYGNKESIVECDENVSLLDIEDLKKTYGKDLNYFKTNFFKYSNDDHCHEKFNKNAIIELEKRLESKDFVLGFWGFGNFPIYEYVEKMKKALFVEASVGYYNSFSKYRVYVSYALHNFQLGLENKSSNCLENKPRHYDTVIPLYFDLNDFNFNIERGDYFLFISRIHECKGIHIAIQLAKKTNIKLKICGQGNISEYLDINDKSNINIEYIGYADIELRKELMSKAKGLLIFSDYVEPFGAVVTEAMLSGCPVICHDFGAFSENVIHSITGYRCKTFEHMIWAINNIHIINPNDCRKFAINNYSFDKISVMYEEYFYSLQNLFLNGWYQENDNRTDLNYLKSF